MARRQPTRDDIDVALETLDWLAANVDDPGWRDEIAHVGFLLERDGES